MFDLSHFSDFFPHLWLLRMTFHASLLCNKLIWCFLISWTEIHEHVQSDSHPCQHPPDASPGAGAPTVRGIRPLCTSRVGNLCTSCDRYISCTLNSYYTRCIVGIYSFIKFSCRWFNLDKLIFCLNKLEFWFRLFIGR